MSRIGKQPVPIPDKVKVTLTGDTVLVEGPKGKVSKLFAPVVKITIADKKVIVSPTDDDSRFAKAMYGTVRSVIAGMVMQTVKPGLELVKNQGSGPFGKQVAHDEQRPPLTDHVHRTCDGAGDVCERLLGHAPR